MVSPSLSCLSMEEHGDKISKPVHSLGIIYLIENSLRNLLESQGVTNLRNKVQMEVLEYSLNI